MSVNICLLRIWCCSS